jgi:hypothetical protein
LVAAVQHLAMAVFGQISSRNFQESNKYVEYCKVVSRITCLNLFFFWMNEHETYFSTRQGDGGRRAAWLQRFSTSLGPYLVKYFPEICKKVTSTIPKSPVY